jgi:hypothetical protein
MNGWVGPKVSEPGDTPKAAFNEAVETTLGACLAVSNQRGTEYEDSWALENQATRFMDLALRETGDDRGPAAKRILMVASLCDVKVSRTLGPFKEDTLDDLINYLGAFRHWMALYVAAKAP